MSIRFILLVCLVLNTSALADATPIKLDEVVDRVSSRNYNVYANALKVYQAKENVTAARMNLLPKLNLWRVGAVFIDPSAAVDLVTQDIAPFLVPSNWFRAIQADLLYNAEREGYRALWANEVLNAKAIYFHALMDRSILEHVEKNMRELNRLLVIVRSREELGGVPEGTSRDIEIRLLGLEEDKRSLQVLLANEESLLAFMMGYSTTQPVELEKVRFPDFENFEPLRYEDFEYRAVDTAPELRQFDYMLQAAEYIDGEIWFSFLGASSASRGVAGGVFDHIPIQDGLGFGAGAAIRITEAQREILKTQKKGIIETIKRQLKLLIDTYNLDLIHYDNLKRRVALTQRSVDQLFERMSLGHEVDAMDLIRASKEHIDADTAFFAVKYRFLTHEDRLARIIFHGDYTKEPILIERL